jgi:rhodanese-related sulfurtransferase
MAVRTISVEVLAGWLRSAEPPRLIDVLSGAYFERARLPGAENIPRAELHARARRARATARPPGPTSCSRRTARHS